jgi:hypothetical protein
LLLVVLVFVVIAAFAGSAAWAIAAEVNRQNTRATRPFVRVASPLAFLGGRPLHADPLVLNHQRWFAAT